ncbi:MAG: type II toxin-antitoxin system HicB family antitoxin [Oscillospiraceae bacterium]|nr:type II toxin-antitoxin system HicB family antitoxin [Oscillospiraceae bacterium]
MRKITYIGVFEPCNDGGYSVYFPDLPGCASGGDDLEESQHNAAAALNLHIYGMEKDGESIPAPSKVPVIDPQTEPGYLLSPVTIYPDIFKVDRDSRAVRTNTSIPSWLKDMAEARGINYSQVLETALMEMMDVGPVSGSLAARK